MNMNPNRKGGAGASPAFYSGASNNPRPSNPPPSAVSVGPGAPPSPAPVAQLRPAPRVNSFQFPRAIPGAPVGRTTKPL
jgi:hypothetical protein